MRFQFATVSRAKALVRGLKIFLPAVRLSELQDIAARMYGYPNWHELERTTKLGGPSTSAWDEACTAELAQQRYGEQTECLRCVLGPEYHGAAPVLVGMLKPTSKFIFERRHLPGEGQLSTPSRSLVSYAMFEDSDEQLGDYARFWQLPVLDDDEVRRAGHQIPRHVADALLEPRPWNEAQFLHGLDGALNQCAWYRWLEVSPEGSPLSAATWHYEIQEYSARAMPKIKFVVDMLWARAHHAPDAGPTLGRMCAFAHWRKWLAAWTTAKAEADRTERRRKERLTKLELIKEATEEHENEAAERDELSIALELPDIPLSLPSMAGLYSNFSYAVAQRGGSRLSAVLRITYGEYVFRLTFHNQASWGTLDRDFDSSLNLASKAVLASKFAEPSLGKNPIFMHLRILEKRERRRIDGVQGIARMQSADEIQQLYESTRRRADRKGLRLVRSERP